MNQEKPKLVALPVTGQFEINDKIVQTLEELLEKAKRGEISSIAACYLKPNGNYSFAWHSGRTQGMMLQGVMHQMIAEHAGRHAIEDQDVDEEIPE